ncbi:MAG: hypothetical protein ACSHYB_15800 [Roseibacillus sp.]
MKLQNLSIAAIILTSNAGAVTLNQIDTFDSGLAAWGNNAGSTSVQDTGLAGGSYLQVTSSGGGGRGSRLATFNSSQWTGDYLTSGVTGFNLDALNGGTDSLNLRFAFDGPGGWFITSSALLANSTSISDLQSFSFSIEPGDVSAAGSSGTGIYADTFSNVTEFEILAAASIPGEGGGGNLTGDQIDATLWIDNIQAIPEPSVAVISTIALLGFAIRRRR